MSITLPQPVVSTARPCARPAIRRPVRATRALVGLAFVVASVELVRLCVAAFGPLGWISLWLPLMVTVATALCAAMTASRHTPTGPRAEALRFTDPSLPAPAGVPCVVAATTIRTIAHSCALDPRPVQIDFYSDDAVTVLRGHEVLWSAPHTAVRAVDVTGTRAHPADPVESADLPDMYVALHTDDGMLTVRPAAEAPARLDVIVHDLHVDRRPVPTVPA